MSKFLTEKSQKVPRTPRGAWRGALAISFVTHKSLNYYSRNYPPIELLITHVLLTGANYPRIGSPGVKWRTGGAALILSGSDRIGQSQASAGRAAMERRWLAQAATVFPYGWDGVSKNRVNFGMRSGHVSLASWRNRVFFSRVLCCFSSPATV